MNPKKCRINHFEIHKLLMVKSFYFSKLHCFERPYIKTKSHVKKVKRQKLICPQTKIAHFRILVNMHFTLVILSL